ncbi:MAG: OpgC domain-containing protein [Bradyrhizobiaceae bacterium]|nr:OpgC domain-containing protein [Hyphomicrobiales bacterium]MBV9426751.1 OpgC domain-containing protein [Bradyrhizobiaceae bacterium]
MPPPAAAPKRDHRIDVLRGVSLLMIFVDHIPDNVLSLATMHNFGFCDAAEAFVLLAGMSSMLAYGRAFERSGAVFGLRHILRRWVRLYAFQLGWLLTTLVVVYLWTSHYGFQPRIVAPLLNDPWAGLLHSITLRAVPAYLDILPLYLALFAIFPFVYAGLRFNVWLTLALSGALWAAANLATGLNLPNWMSGGEWFFNPFAWQFLFVIGAALTMLLARYDGELPRLPWLAWLCAAYLIFALIETVPWTDWHLWDLRPIALPGPDKTSLATLRLIHILALTYLLFSSDRVRAISASPLLRPVDVCGRHSLEVFSIGCVAALFGRLIFRTYGPGLVAQIGVNAIGFAAMGLLAIYLDHRQVQRRRKAEAVRPAEGARQA